jgi:ligand-binding SRPBCC domain-containing protein
VRAFHHDTRTLKKLNPPPIIVQLHRVDPLAEGSISEFTLWMGPLPIRWRAVHSQVSEFGFTDTQERGPLAHWQHSHRFEPLDEAATRVHEHIKYRHHPGWRGLFSRLLFGPLSLRLLFAYRKWVTRRAMS